MTRADHNNRSGSGGQMEPAPEILDGELITDAEYAWLKGWNLLPILAVARVISGPNQPRAITMAVLSGLARAARSVARAGYRAGKGHASSGRRGARAPA